MDAKTLFQEGVVAIRDQKDATKGRELLMQSLKIEPKNEMAWLWLSRTMAEPQKKIQCLERALKLNPANEQTRSMITKLLTDGVVDDNDKATPAPASKPAPTPQIKKLTPEKTDTSNWNSLRISTSEMNAVGNNSLKPQVTAEMEDMGLTPDLGAVLTATSSELRTATKRATSEMASTHGQTASSNGIHDLRAVDDEPEAPPAAKIVPRKIELTTAENTQIKNFLSQAQSLLNKNKIEEAIEQWVRVLDIEVDNEAALGNAVRYLSRLKYIDDARELVWNAINSGTTHPSIYLTAIDIAKYQGHEGEADDLRLHMVQLPEAGEKTVMAVVEHFVANQPQKALQALDLAIPLYPKSQKITFRRAQLAEEMGLRKEAVTYYEEAAQLGTRSKEGQIADKKLGDLMPHLTDRERGSVALALREALGVGFLYLLMAFQDAGLNLLQLGPSRIGGIVMSIVGGYLLVTATSSAQQKPLASWLGGSVPVKVPKPKEKAEKEDVVKAVMGDPDEVPTELPIIPLAIRIVIGVAGAVILVAAFVLVFNAAIGLLRNGSPKQFYVPTLDDFANP
ncbi:MAG: tetratricopeptide repeat protein [Anaerolineae bacterium]|nr:tetratricopeptide repeat protein [Anaerolineae bacterium]